MVTNIKYQLNTIIYTIVISASTVTKNISICIYLISLMLYQREVLDYHHIFTKPRSNVRALLNYIRYMERSIKYVERISSIFLGTYILLKGRRLWRIHFEKEREFKYGKKTWWLQSIELWCTVFSQFLEWLENYYPILYAHAAKVILSNRVSDAETHTQIQSLFLFHYQ